MLAAALAVLAALVVVLAPARSPASGPVVFALSSSAGETLAPTTVMVGSHRLTVAGDVPKAPEVRTAARLSLDPGSYGLQVDGFSLPAGLTIRSNQVEPVLLAVSGGRVGAGGVYSGTQDLNLGLSELTGQLTRLGDFLSDLGAR